MREMGFRSAASPSPPAMAGAEEEVAPRWWSVRVDVGEDSGRLWRCELRLLRFRPLRGL